MSFFLVAACRAIVEMLLFCFLGQGALYVLAGESRKRNPIYALLAIITQPLLRLAENSLPAGLPVGAPAALAVVLLFLSWLGLAALKIGILL